MYRLRCALHHTFYFVIGIIVVSSTLLAQENHISLQLIPVTLHGKEGYVDRTGKVIIPAKFDSASYFDETNRAFAEVGRKWGLIDETGRWIIKPQYDLIFGFREGLALVKTDKVYSYINADGQVIAGGFTNAYSFSEGMAPVRIGSKWGFINKQGEIVIAPIYDHAVHFSDGLAPVCTNDMDKCFYINPRGQTVIDLDGGIFSEGLAAVKFDRQYGFINTSGEVVIAPKFDEVGEFTEGLVRVQIESKWGFINKRGQMVVKPRFDEVEDFTEGLGRVELNGKNGFVDRTGKIKIALQFDAAGTFHDGLAYAEVGDKWGYIDREGKFVFSFSTQIKSPLLISEKRAQPRQ
jgi:hypothetical protein